jgi:hypothetical protein
LSQNLSRFDFYHNFVYNTFLRALQNNADVSNFDVFNALFSSKTYRTEGENFFNTHFWAAYDRTPSFVTRLKFFWFQSVTQELCGVHPGFQFAPHYPTSRPEINRRRTFFALIHRQKCLV